VTGRFFACFYLYSELSVTEQWLLKLAVPNLVIIKYLLGDCKTSLGRFVEQYHRVRTFSYTCFRLLLKE